MIYPNGLITEYGYDNLNRLISVKTRNLTGALLASYAYTLNARSQRTRVVEGAGGPVSRTIDYLYDDADRLVEERITDPVLGNRVITYTYDPVGNRLEKNDNGVITTYSYSELFPDAGIVGFSVVGQFRCMQYKLLKDTFTLYRDIIIPSGIVPAPMAGELGGLPEFGIFKKVPMDTTAFHQNPGAQPVANVSVGGGGEILFSVASAQIGGFLYGTIQGEVGVGDFNVNSSDAHHFDIPVTLYHGWVWNLWNAKDYSGWFLTVNFTGRKSGMSLFKDLIRPFAKGPYGFAFPFANFSLLKNTSYKPINTVAPSFAYYRYGSAINCTAPWKVAFWWTLAEAGVLAISIKTQSPTGLMSAAIGVSWPFTIARLKSVWNKRYDYSVEKRQATPDRPPEFSTGPLQWSTFF